MQRNGDRDEHCLLCGKGPGIGASHALLPIFVLLAEGVKHILHTLVEHTLHVSIVYIPIDTGYVMMGLCSTGTHGGRCGWGGS